MTNAEYECSCIGAANAPCRTEGERRLEAKDNAIAVLEATLAVMQEERREIINRYNLNKLCAHKNLVLMPGLYLAKNHPDNKSGYDFCTDCGAKLPI